MCPTDVTIYGGHRKTKCQKSLSGLKMTSLKQLPGECFTRSLHGIHKNDEGLGVKFDTIVMQGVFLMKYKYYFTY